MSTENRDLIRERLERQLIEKERECEALKTSLRDSILSELRRELQNDLDLNNRISKLEQKVTELSNNLSGMMDELLDQKTVLRSASRMLDKSEKAAQIQQPAPVPEIRPAPAPPLPTPSPTPPPEQPAYMISPFPKPRQPPSRTTVQTRDVPTRTPHKPQTNVHLNIRDAASAPEAKPRQPETKTEYIVAKSNEPSAGSLQKHHIPPVINTGEYIIAEDRKTRPTVSRTPFEDVESREDEDVEITTTSRSK